MMERGRVKTLQAVQPDEVDHLLKMCFGAKDTVGAGVLLDQALDMFGTIEYIVWKEIDGIAHMPGIEMLIRESSQARGGQ